MSADLPGKRDDRRPVVYAVEKEMCRRTPDFMLRRSGAGLVPGEMERSGEVRRLLAEVFSWDEEQCLEDLRQTEWEASKIAVPT